MPGSMVWSSRRPLYKLNLAALLTLAPFNLLSMVLPFWLETKAVMMISDDHGKVTKDLMLTYGVWQLCADSQGCRSVNDDHFSTGVGAWMYPIKLFMVVSVLCHLCASFCGALQNFLPRDYVRHWRNTCLRPLLHRDAPYAEDIGFMAGFFGTLSCIIFMLSTKEKISDGAHYQWGFAFAFMSSSLTVMVTLTLTKAHIMTVPRPPSTRRSGSTPNPSDPGRDRGASSTSGYLAALRTDEIHLEERQPGSQAEGRTSAGRTAGHVRFSASRRQRSRLRDRHGNPPGPGRQSSGPTPPNPPRLVRSPELENIPAAVTPLSAPCPRGGSGNISRSRARPITCLHMSDLRSTTSSMPEAGSANSAAEQVPSAPPVEPSTSGDSHVSSGKGSESSGKKEIGSHSAELHRTQSVAVVKLPPGDENVGVRGGYCGAWRARNSTDNDAVASGPAESHRF